MEILKLLKVAGASEPNAAMLNDSGEEYPVFLKALHNTILFDEILASGYALAGMPFDFVKHGLSIMELPVEDYTPTPDELQLMYDSIGKAHDMSYLMSKIDTSIVRGLPTPPTNYTITTREAFLKYLQSLTFVDSEDEFVPINYFVSPEARFDLAEYNSAEYARYVRIMDRHRSMSYNKFQSLVKWLTQFGLSPNASFLDILDAYFAWGFDGLNVPLVSKTREHKAISNSLNADPIERKITGLIDGSGNIYPPIHARSVVWQPDVASEERLQQIYRRLKDNEVTTIQLKSTGGYDVINISGIGLTAEIAQYHIKINSKRYPSISVQSIANAGQDLPAEMVLPQNKSRMFDYCLAEAIALDNYKGRKDNTIVSSYQVLQWSGATPENAIRYILRTIGMLATSSDKRFGPDGLQRIMPYDIQAYLNGHRNPPVVDENGNEVANPTDELIYNIIHGNVNTDMVDRGLAKDAIVDATSLHNVIMTLHDTLEIPYADIYKQICNLPEGVNTAVVTNGKLAYNLDVSRINNALTGYEIDMREYDDKRANDCTYFYYVTLVALECAGDANDKALSDRAVGFEALTVNLVEDKEAAEVINMLVSKLLDAVEYTQLTVSVKERLEESARRWAINSWFEIYARGTYTLPAILGGISTEVSANIRAIVRNCTRTAVDSTIGFCSMSLRVYEDNAYFEAYCVNAYVSVDRVIPRNDSSTIKAIPFYAAWCDFKKDIPALFAKLVEMGVLKSDFVPWSLRYAREQVWRSGDIPLYSETSLLTYYEDAVEFLNDYPRDLEFKCVPHFVDVAYPGLNNDIITSSIDSDDVEDAMEEEIAHLTVPRTGAPVIRTGLMQTLKASEMTGYLKPTSTKEKLTVYLQKFLGFTANVLLHCPTALDKIPSTHNKVPVMVMSDAGKIMLTDTKELIDFTRIATIEDKYPIAHIYDNMYLICSMDGILWEARL